MRKITLLILLLMTGYISLAQLSVAGISNFYGNNSGDGEYGNEGVKSSSTFGIQIGYDLGNNENNDLNIFSSYSKGDMIYDSYLVYINGASQPVGYQYGSYAGDEKDRYTAFRIGAEFLDFFEGSKIYWGLGLGYIKLTVDGEDPCDSFFYFGKLGIGKGKGLYVNGGFEYFSIGEDNYLKFPSWTLSLGYKFN